LFPHFGRMGRLEKLVDTPEKTTRFRKIYNVPKGIDLKYILQSGNLVPNLGEVVFPQIAVGSPSSPLYRFSKLFHNFQIVMEVIELNKGPLNEPQVHEINWLYLCHKIKHNTFYLKARNQDQTLVNALPNLNKSLDEDYLVVSGNWAHDWRKCPETKGRLVLDPPLHFFLFFFFSTIHDQSVVSMNINGTSRRRRSWSTISWLTKCWKSSSLWTKVGPKHSPPLMGYKLIYKTTTASSIEHVPLRTNK
jgi:hypothetical protein